MLSANYKQVLLTLVGNLKQLRDFSTKLHFENLIKLIDGVIKRIENDSFSIAVVGEFKRGKSTFINALLGEEILPSDVLPTTATLNRVIYGSEPFVKIIFKDGEERKIAIHKLVHFVSKLTVESQAVAATVQEAVIHYPVEHCGNNVDIIDTPGLSDDENMTAVTLSVIQSVEAAIMVTSALAPFSESEGNFITEKLLTNSVGRVLFVVNGIDSLNHERDVNKAIKTVERRIKECIENWLEQEFTKDSKEYNLHLKKFGNLQIFGLSAYQALSAKQNSDEKLIDQSRFRQFESALRHILLTERGKIILQVGVNQELDLATKVLKIIDSQQRELRIQQENFLKKYNDINSVVVKFKEIKTQRLSYTIAAVDNIKLQVNSLIDQLENQIEQAVEEVIESTEVNLTDGTKVLLEQCAVQVANAVQSVSQKIAEQIQILIQQELSAAVQRIQTLVEIAPEVMSGVEMHLSQLDRDIVFEGNSGVVNNSLNQALNEFHQNNQEHLSNLPTLFTCSSEVFLWEDESKGQGLYTVVGGAAGSLFGPLGIAIGAAVGAGIGNVQKARNFKNNYKLKIIAAIESQLRGQNPKQVSDDYVYRGCKNLEVLKNRVEQEIIIWIESMQNVLARLLGKQQVLVENERQELDTMHRETENILNHAWMISEELYEIISGNEEGNFQEKICQACSYSNESISKFCIKCGTRLS